MEKEIPFDDPRVNHITSILGLKLHDEFSAGIVGGDIGKGCLLAKHARGWYVGFTPFSKPAPLHPVILLMGCPRPPVARRILKDLTSMGIQEIRACSTDLNEKSYLSSKLWRTSLWRNALIDGAMQAATTQIPILHTAEGLHGGIKELPDAALRIALDNATDTQEFPRTGRKIEKAILAVGPERGWSDRERKILRAHGFTMVGIGKRILRTETACAVGVALLFSRMGIY